MCSLPLHNGLGSARSVTALPVAVIKSLPLATGLGLSLTIVLLYSSNTLAQTVTVQEVAQLSTTQSVTQAGTQSNTQVSATSQHLLFVSPVIGNDANADGSQRSPFRTITHALQVAQPNTVIMLSAGTYSADAGEVFPLMLKPGITIQGDPSTQGRGIVIRGGGAFLSSTSAGQNITILGADQTQLIGVTITNPNPHGYGVWVESGSPVIADSTFTGNSHNGISTVGNGTPLVRNNRFNQANKVDLAGIGATASPIASQPSATAQSGSSLAGSPTNPPTTQAQVNSAQIHAAQIHSSQSTRTVTRPVATPRIATVITEPPPSTISTLPPSRNTSQTVASTAQVSSQAARSTANSSGVQTVSSPSIASPAPLASASSLPVSRSTPANAIRVPPPTHSQGTIVPIAQRRSVQPSIEISVPPPESVSPPAVSPPDNALQPAVATRAQTASTPQITPIAAALPVRSPSVNSSPGNSTRSAAASSSPSSSPPSSSPPSSNPPSSSPTSSNSRNSVPPRSITVSQTSGSSSRSAVPAASNRSAAAINIPVPPPNPAPQTTPVPQTTLAYAPRPSASFNAPIDIPVPPPESSSVAPAAVRSQDVPSPPQLQGGTLTTNLLPVPSGDVPVGNVGDLPRISVASSQMGGVYYASSIRSDLRYRVVVDASSEGMQSLVQSLIPSAFLTSINGQQLMQVGAFSSRDNAEQAAQLLSQNGLVAVIQEID